MDIIIYYLIKNNRYVPRVWLGVGPESPGVSRCQIPTMMENLGKQQLERGVGNWEYDS